MSGAWGVGSALAAAATVNNAASRRNARRVRPMGGVMAFLASNFIVGGQCADGLALGFLYRGNRFEIRTQIRKSKNPPLRRRTIRRRILSDSLSVRPGVLPVSSPV